MVSEVGPEAEFGGLAGADGCSERTPWTPETSEEDTEPEREIRLAIISPNHHLLELRNRNKTDGRRIFIGLILAHSPGSDLIRLGIDQPS